MNDAAQDTLPWWHYGHLWLVIAGPAVVVVACMVTIWLAVTRPDPVLGVDVPRRAATAAPVAAVDLPSRAALLPALQARNHAAAPAAVMPPPRP